MRCDEAMELGLFLGWDGTSEPGAKSPLERRSGAPLHPLIVGGVCGAQGKLPSKVQAPGLLTLLHPPSYLWAFHDNDAWLFKHNQAC